MMNDTWVVYPKNRNGGRWYMAVPAKVEAYPDGSLKWKPVGLGFSAPSEGWALSLADECGRKSCGVRPDIYCLTAATRWEIDNSI